MRRGKHFVMVIGVLVVTVTSIASTASVRPGEVLEALELGDLESRGAFLSRTSVELTS